MSTTLPAGTATGLQDRARRLRSQAVALHPVVAEAYRRRAAEVDLQAWLEAVWNPPIDPTQGLPTDAPRHPGVHDGQRHLAVA